MKLDQIHGGLDHIQAHGRRIPSPTDRPASRRVPRQEREIFIAAPSDPRSPLSSVAATADICSDTATNPSSPMRAAMAAAAADVLDADPTAARLKSDLALLFCKDAALAILIPRSGNAFYLPARLPHSRTLLRYGCAAQSKKGEDFFPIKTDCQRVSGSPSTFSIFIVLDGHNSNADVIFTRENLLSHVMGVMPRGFTREEWLHALPCI